MVRNFAFRLCAVAVLSVLISGSLSAGVAPYDPLRGSESFKPATVDLVVRDDARHRDIPVLVYLPAAKEPAPVVLFSHGLGGNRQGSAFLGNHWAARGYVVVFVQHPGSDDGVWKNEQPARRMAALRNAANPENFMLRVKDIPAVLDQLDRWNREKGGQLAGRMNLAKIGMSGHSFGAVTTQAVSGQTLAGGAAPFTDRRITSAMAFSPSSRKGGDPKQSFGAVKIPWMLMTGTKDVAAIGDADLESRLAVFPALPAGGKYEVVLFNAEHSAFTDRALPGDREPRNPNHHKVILALGTAFWDATLRGDAAAKAWLDGDGPRTVLEPKDAWQRK